MKKIRVIANNPFMIMLMISSVLFISCGKDEIANSTTNDQIALSKSVQSRITGQDLFKSIIFADGVVTNQLSQLDLMSEQIQKFSSEDIASYREMQERVIQHLHDEDELFFEQFKKDILSGDAKVISNAMQNSAQKLHSYTITELANKNIDIQEHFEIIDSDLDLSDYENATYGVGLVILVTVVIALFLVINVNVNETKNSDIYANVQMASASSTIVHQKLVVEIANLNV